MLESLSFQITTGITTQVKLIEPGLIEPLDERVAEFLKPLIRQGTKNTKELQRRALEYVKESLF